MKKALKILLSVILWIIEYFLIFGVFALPFGKPLMQVSLLLYWVAFAVFIGLCVLTWRLTVKKDWSKKNESK